MYPMDNFGKACADWLRAMSIKIRTGHIIDWSLLAGLIKLAVSFKAFEISLRLTGKIIQYVLVAANDSVSKWWLQ